MSRGLVLVAFVGWLAWALGDEPKKWPEGILPGGNVLSCESYSFNSLLDKKQITLFDVALKLKQLGIKGVSLNDIYFPSFDDTYLDQLDAAINGCDRVVTAFIIDKNGDFANDDEATRRANVEAVRKRLAVAKRLRAPVVRINVGSTGRGEAADGKEGVDRVIEAFKSLLPTAKELGIKLAIENHWGASTRSAFVLRIIQATDMQWVGSCLDFKNWPKDADPYLEIRNLAPRAFHTHAKSHAFDENGEETGCDYARVFALLRHNGYRGAISIEWEGQGDCIEGIKKTRDLILKHWTKA
ncbi:MAG: sugar phosphate isomerase/epimerase [Planctomycetes bacterium]|nr:sugar phosphate isomerase/epimerase [Planctomycetota bacterium]MBI3846894.1 sugar phosphate isomerase/epimerase [Planctomycetota bacterium]